MGYTVSVIPAFLYIVQAASSKISTGMAYFQLTFYCVRPRMDANVFCITLAYLAPFFVIHTSDAMVKFSLVTTRFYF